MRSMLCLLCISTHTCVIIRMHLCAGTQPKAQGKTRIKNEYLEPGALLCLLALNIAVKVVRAVLNARGACLEPALDVVAERHAVTKQLRGGSVR